MPGMFEPAEPNNRFSKKEMLNQLTLAGSTCKLCSTEPAGFVYQQYQQSCHCPRCGMPPIPLPEFMKPQEGE